jgi:hypothetical protein
MREEGSMGVSTGATGGKLREGVARGGKNDDGQHKEEEGTKEEGDIMGLGLLPG